MRFLDTNNQSPEYLFEEEEFKQKTKRDRIIK
jgi:hypothetical protein